MAAKMTDYGNNIAGLKRALRSLPKETKTSLTDASKDIAEDVASDARALASGLGMGWTYLAPTIRASRSSIPDVKMGGKRKIPGRKGSRQTVGDLLWGLEFGGGARPETRQFMPHRGQEGYALWPTVRARSEDTGRRYGDALAEALRSI